MKIVYRTSPGEMVLSGGVIGATGNGFAESVCTLKKGNLVYVLCVMEIKILSNLFIMQNGEVFLFTAGAIGLFTILNLTYVKRDIVSTLKNNPERVDYFQKGANSSAKKINATALFSYFQPIHKKKYWTASNTKADKVKVLTSTTSLNPKKRQEASKKIAKHMVRTGTGVVGRSDRLYNYYG